MAIAITRRGLTVPGWVLFLFALFVPSAIGAMVGYFVIFPHEGKRTLEFSRPDVVGYQVGIEDLSFPTNGVIRVITPEQFASLGLKPKAMEINENSAEVVLTKLAVAPSDGEVDFYVTHEQIYQVPSYGRGISSVSTAEGKINIFTDRTMGRIRGRAGPTYLLVGLGFMVFFASFVLLIKLFPSEEPRRW